MRTLVSERNVLLLLSLVLATALWYYVTSAQTPRLRGSAVKSVAVVPTIVGEPAYGYSVVGVRVIPQAVTATGDPARLEHLDTLITEPVNVTGAIRDVMREVAVIATPEISASGRVRVAVQIAPAVAVTIIRGVRIQIRNTPPGVVARLQPETVELRVQGPVTIVTRLRAEDFSAVIDGVNLSEGNRHVPVEVRAPAQVEVLAVTPPAVLVSARKGG